MPGRLVLPILLLTPVATWCYHQVQTDDPYITFRYARNLLDGEGLVYNAGQWVLGTTAPLHAMLLAAGGLLTTDLPLLTSLVNGAALAVLAWLLARLMAIAGEASAGALAALLVVTNPLMGDAFGFELNLFLALTLGGVVAYFSDRPQLAALLLALGTLTRGDGAVPAVLVFFHHLWVRRSFPVWPALIYGAVCGGWGLLAWTTYGTPFPNTLAAKRAMGDSGLWRPFWYGALRMPYLYLQQTPLFLWFGPVALFGLVRLRRNDERLWLVLFWTGIVFAAYAAMRIPAASNYYAAMVPSLMLVVALGVIELAERVVARTGTRRFAVVVAVVTLPLVIAQAIPVIDRVATNPDARYRTYRATGEWLAANTPATAAVGLVESGMGGYFSNRPVVDVCGLVEPAVAAHLAGGDTSWPLRHFRPDYILLHDPVWDLEADAKAAPWFTAEYEPVCTFAGEEPYKLALYRRR